ncbi:hypothetical protein CHGG_06338 [Chaetomium globosum CBS 148.51]|uniref:Nuclease S1 n=1 Tax=Chaetomium globosum (strain ATCC 6205 / CBS 148.51 / DSM 1962 / NBRC 6347 / NRRL 1970) TaxID=306901 RepID=Q2H4S7_CHAGB|nr:uncharacterized protein CHGG_06338 [Chaetomium globosum CBS 148.51]EAQ89719.1 hypothetical protein CHGG_06338 [Chaetomium globosum CBS 148.51]
MAVNNKLTRPIERLAAYLKRGVGSEFKTVLVRDMLHRHGLSEAGTHDKFELRFAQRSVRAHLRTGGIFAPSPNAPPGLAFLDLDAVAKRRDLSVTYQIPHLTSRPVARILHKKLNRIRPIEEIYDPYIAAVLIALAQEQRRAGAVPDSCRTPPTSGGLDSDSSTHTPQDSLGPKPSQQSFADTVPLHHYHLTLKSPAQISDMISTMAKSMSRVPFRSGSFGHITVGYLASAFVSPATTTYLQTLLRNDTAEYLAGVATWADSIRYTKWGRFTSDFHFIDAKDDPPRYCGVDFARDCKKDRGCVVSALHNYTTRLLDAEGALPAWQRAQAAKFVVHFVGDIHQPLHTENVERGGNGIDVLFDGRRYNLHHVWDSSIAEKLVGGVRRRGPYSEAKRWAEALAREINEGKFASERINWLRSANLSDPVATAMAWAEEANAYVCTTVLPEGPDAIRGQELGSDYYEAAAPVIEVQVARAGYRLAAWLDLIVTSLKTESLSDDL